MGTKATLNYSVVAQGAALSDLSLALASVPFPPPPFCMGGVNGGGNLLDFLGVLLLSDSTDAFASRTLTLGLVPTTPATAIATVFPGDPSGSPIDTLAVTNPGVGYAAPPDVFITDATGPGKNAKANAQLNVASILAVTAGLYTSPAGPTVTIVGGLGKGGVAATAIPIMAPLGPNFIVAAVNLVTHGSNYMGVPTVMFSGGGQLFPAAATAILQVSGLTLLGRGKFYLTPVVTLQPKFLTMFPNSSDQRAPFWNLMKPGIERALTCPVNAAPPVIT